MLGGPLPPVAVAARCCRLLLLPAGVVAAGGVKVVGGGGGGFSRSSEASSLPRSTHLCRKQERRFSVYINNVYHQVQAPLAADAGSSVRLGYVRTEQ